MLPDVQGIGGHGGKLRLTQQMEGREVDAREFHPRTRTFGTFGCPKPPWDMEAALVGSRVGISQ